MKHLPILLSTSLLFVACPSTRAASTDLLVNGSITPGAACVVSVGGPSIDLGEITRDMLNPDPTKSTELAERRVMTGVTCQQPTRHAFVVTEAKGGDAAHPFVFAMNDTNKKATAGSLFLLFDAQSTKIDGKQGYATGASGTTDLEHATWGPSTSPRENLPITNGRYAVGFVMGEGSEEAPDNIRDLSVYLLVRPKIHPMNDLDLTDTISFASDLGLELRYF